MKPLSTFEIIGVIAASVAALIGSFGLGWQLQQGRIDNLKDRQPTAVELEAKLNIVIKALELEKQKAIQEGINAAVKEKAEGLEKVNALTESYKKVSQELADYKEANAKAVTRINSLAEVLKKSHESFLGAINAAQTRTTKE